MFFLVIDHFPMQLQFLEVVLWYAVATSNYPVAGVAPDAKSLLCEHCNTQFHTRALPYLVLYKGVALSSLRQGRCPLCLYLVLPKHDYFLSVQVVSLLLVDGLL